MIKDKYENLVNFSDVVIVEHYLFLLIFYRNLSGHGFALENVVNVIN